MSTFQDSQVGRGVLTFVAAFFFLSIILLILMIAFAIFPDKLLYSEKINPQELSKDSALTTKTFKIPEDVSICRFDIITDLQRDGIHWIAFDTDIYNQEDEPINSFSGEVYYEFGHDSDGNWSEAEENIKHHFKIDSAQGQQFYAEIYAEKGLDVLSANKAKVEFRVKDGQYSFYRKVSGYASLISFLFCVVILFGAAGVEGTFR